MENQALMAAITYSRLGFSVIPLIPGEKKPAVAWKPYQKKRADEKQITAWWSANPKCNVGIVTGEISDLFVVDIDSEEGHKNLSEYGVEDIYTPTVDTPRGGKHVYFRFPKGSNITIGAGKIPGTDFRGESGYVAAPPSINGTGKPYSWSVGLDQEISTALPEPYIKKLLSTIIYSRKNDLSLEGSDSCRITPTTNYDMNDIILQEGTRDSDLFRIGMAMADGRCKRSDMAQVMEILAKNCKPPFPEKELQTKIKSILDRIHAKDRNLTDEVREWCLRQKGYFFTTEVRHDLHITTKIDINTLSVIINRLEDQGIIEKQGEKRGCYRTKEAGGSLDMRFIEEEIPEFDVRLPFGLNGIMSLYPKNIIIVAGSKGAGKTALLLKIARDNQDLNDVVYMNSEMGDEEWSMRLKKIGIMRAEDMRFRAMGVHKNFHDHMEPCKKIYIIDYLEIHDNFYEIAKPIRLIHEAIKDGIAIIAVQKKGGVALGRGAEFSMEKSRLYLSLDFLKDQRCTQMTIVDAKSPKVPETPSGWSKRIKFMDFGSRMEALDKDWVM